MKDDVFAFLADEKNHRLAFSLANRYKADHRVHDRDDLAQWGHLKLLEVADRYRRERGPVSSYAYHVFAREMTQATSSRYRGPFGPYRSWAVQFLKKFREARAAVSADATDADVIEGMGLSPQSRRYLENILSLADAERDELHEDGGIDALPADDGPGGGVEGWAEVRDEVEYLLSRLGDRERRVVELMFGLDGGPPMTKAEAARAMGSFPSSIWHTHERAMRKLRKAAAWSAA